MDPAKKTFISVVIPCYNEEAILESNLNKVVCFLEGKRDKYLWELVLVDDGSKDNTGKIVDEFAKHRTDVQVIHHPINLNLGLALQTGFLNAKGEVIVVLDVDLSYSVEYVEQMVDKLVETSADIVLASPYMKGGKVTGVPFSRRLMSKWVNRIMRIAAQDKYHTY